VEKLHRDGDAVLGEGYFPASEVSPRLQEIDSLWANLLAKSSEKNQHLIEAQQFVDFNREIDELLAYVQDSSITAKSADVGLNVERCESLQKKFEDFANDVTANYLRVEALQQSASTLRDNSHPDIARMESRLKVRLF
jgi:hypothetical protein